MRTDPKAILKYPGAKWKIASWVVSHYPVHRHYVEPYCGSAACFFAKKPAMHEVLNDLNESIVNLFRVLRTRGEELAEVISLSAWSEQEYNEIEGKVVCDDELEHARRFLVRSWQAHGGTIAQISSWKHNGLIGNVYPAKGSGSFEDADPFQIVAMEEEPQTSIMHKQRCAKKREFFGQNDQGVGEVYYSSALYEQFHLFPCLLLYVALWELWPDMHSKNHYSNGKPDKLRE